jgi:osmoprotectant transport system permease protein
VTYLASHLDRVGALLGQHVVLVVVSLALALLVALPAGVIAARNARVGAAILGVTGALYTIPSLALLALLVAVMGLGAPTAIVALVAYAQMILVRGVVAGLRGVDPALVDAARGLGFTARQTLLRVEFPAALPVVLGGVRVATV